MKKQIGLVLIAAACAAVATTWNQDVDIGAKWSEASSWNTGVPPTVSDLALFDLAQANTYDVDVDTSAITRLQQVSQPHTFSGNGSINITISPASHFQNCMYNTLSGGTVTYHVDVSVNTLTAYYAQMNNNNGGTTIFNGSFTVSSGSLLNARGGTHVFNGDLNLVGTMRLDAGSVIISGTGNTLISGDYISTAGPGSELYLNRSGAYTLSDLATGYLRIERTRVYFGADQAVVDGTDVKIYQVSADAALISNGDYDQNFGVLYMFGTSGLDAQMDMNNSDCVWTFEDSSGTTWTHDLVISNVGKNTEIRFAMDGGTGLTDEQIGQITLNGVALTEADVFVEDGYLYLCKSEMPVEQKGSTEPVYVGYYRGSAMEQGIYQFTDLTDPLGTAARVGEWPFPNPTWQKIGFDGDQYYVLNRGTSFGGPGLSQYDGDTTLTEISGSDDFADWNGVGACNGVWYGLYTGSGLNGSGLYMFMDETDPEGTAVQLFSGQSFSSNVWNDVAFDGERYLFVQPASGGDPGIYEYDPDADSFTKISGSETYADWQGLAVFDSDIAPLRNKKAYVLLFGGQSNALGWGYRQYLLDTGNPLAWPQADIDMLHGLNLVVPQDTLVPLQSGTANIVVKPLPNHYPDLTVAPISRFAAELSFARSVRDQLSLPDMRLGIIKYAIGGTTLYETSDWWPDGTADRSADGTRYQNFQKTVWKGLAAMKNKYPTHSVEILGMGWVQGESDAIEGQGENYEANLTRFIADVRATFGVADLPFVLSKLSSNQLEGAPQNELDQWPIVTNAQALVAAADPYVVATDTEGTNYAVSVGYSEGRYHYITPALLQIGYDLADALISICGVDSDNDDLLDEWENSYAPGTAGLGNTPDADYDGDGFTDQEEFQVGTDPTDSDDFLKLSAVSSAGVSWPAQGGVSYRVYQSTNLLSWTAAAGPLLFQGMTNAVVGFSNFIQTNPVGFFCLTAE
ncbi:sialate O-acetylesterase [Tichowtungia aerotolerans]|uniref:Sialate O-acetylesterase domain-containing protein n=1 Tax=Tichowtungia aerotolerans TaxID=2697043 RepID=A0A6P1MBV2_9BACT|nr:sialate O-acetylesterase [Tichowtungia aerotolerans]QHI69056.1 hypothetical protein GT409_06220 [Tichowtungia aerotolerans]